MVPNKLYILTSNYFASVLELLFEHGVDYTLTNVEGSTARDLAVKNGKNKAAKSISHLIKQRDKTSVDGVVRINAGMYTVSIRRCRLFPFSLILKKASNSSIFVSSLLFVHFLFSCKLMSWIFMTCMYFSPSIPEKVKRFVQNQTHSGRDD